MDHNEKNKYIHSLIAFNWGLHCSLKIKTTNIYINDLDCVLGTLYKNFRHINSFNPSKPKKQAL